MASRRSSGRAGGTVGQRPECGLPLSITSQARQVLRVGLASLLRLATSREHLGKWRAQTRSGLSVQTSRPSSLLFPSFGLHTFTGNPATLSRPANLMLLSGDKSLLVGVGIPWHQAGPLGTRAFPFLSTHPVLPCPTGLWVPGPGVGLEGSGRRPQPLRGRRSSTGLASLPQADGSLQGPR